MKGQHNTNTYCSNCTSQPKAMKSPLHSRLICIALTLAAFPATSVVDAIASSSSSNNLSVRSPSSSSASNALALLNTARLMREQRLKNNGKHNLDDDSMDSLKTRIQRKQLHEINNRMNKGESFAFLKNDDNDEEMMSSIKTHSVPSLLQRTFLTQQKKLHANNSDHHMTTEQLWAEALFDEDETTQPDQLFSHILSPSSRPSRTKQQQRQRRQTAEEEEDQFISSRVEAHLPSVNSLRTSLGSEIPDEELQLQIQAAKARAKQEAKNNGRSYSRIAALAFMDLHHSTASATTSASPVEMVAMSSLPSQLPGPASAVLEQRKTPSTTTTRTTSKARRRTSVVAGGGDNGAAVVVERPAPKKTRRPKSVSPDKSSRKTTTATTTRRIVKSRVLKEGGDKPSSSKTKPSKKKVTNIDAKKIKTKDISAIMSTKKTLEKQQQKQQQKLLEVQQQQQQQQEKDKHAQLVEDESSSTARVTHDEEIYLAQIVQKGVELHRVKKDFEETHGRDITRQEWTDLVKLDSPKELRRLVSDYRRAKSKLVMANMGLVHAVVRTRLGLNGLGAGGISYEELVQEGSLGLLRAAELFDPSRGLRFSTYATIWIKGVLGNNNLSEQITLPLREKNKLKKIQKTVDELGAEKSAEEIYKPSDEDIAKRSGMKIEEVKSVRAKMRRAKNVLSLDYQYESQTRSGADNNVMNAFANDKNLMDDADLVEKLQLRADVVASLARNLDPREARLMRLRYGLKDGKSRTIVECAEAMGISRARAQQLAAGCLKKLREADDAQSLQEYLLSVA